MIVSGHMINFGELQKELVHNFDLEVVLGDTIRIPPQATRLADLGIRSLLNQHLGLSPDLVHRV